MRVQHQGDRNLLSRRLSRRDILRASAGAAGVLAATVLVACGGTATGGGSDPIVQLTKKNKFNPSSSTLLRGHTVYFENVTNDTTFNVTCDPSKVKNPKDAKVPQGAQPFDSGDIKPGDTWSYRFEIPGEYTVTSVRQEQDGMVGHITVTA
ncbi:MAG TPA: hypothetical protein VKU87_01810 [Thermomicrobiaceae bacterium]|nr:hypothetical protein [Thermomicrobiaceae bacterium]